MRVAIDFREDSPNAVRLRDMDTGDWLAVFPSSIGGHVLQLQLDAIEAGRRVERDRCAALTEGYPEVHAAILSGRQPND